MYLNLHWGLGEHVSVKHINSYTKINNKYYLINKQHKLESCVTQLVNRKKYFLRNTFRSFRSITQNIALEKIIVDYNTKHFLSTDLNEI